MKTRKEGNVPSINNKSYSNKKKVVLVNSITIMESVLASGVLIILAFDALLKILQNMLKVD
jgi:hypothetical protein